MTEDPTTTSSSAARFDALEICTAHQDQAIEELNAVITAQWAAIEDLKRQVAILSDRIAEAEDRTATTAPPQRPPHY